MTQQGFYRRPLPPALVPFASAEGRMLFREALSDGHLEGWFALAEQFQTQADPAFCGLGTLVVALNALGVDPGRLWKGPWRWYSEELLDCCLPLEAVREKGITLGQFACLARCNGATADVHRADQSSLDAFRADLAAASATPDGTVVAVSYSRGALAQTGDGHFSPVAGLHTGRDLALVLDVARFKYPPHWVPVRALFDAMLPPDATTGLARGWVVLRRGRSGASVLFRLSDARLPWATIARRLLVDVPVALSHADVSTAESVVAALASGLSPEITSLLAEIPHALAELAPEHQAQAEALLAELRRLPVHALVARAVGGGDARVVDLLTMLVLCVPKRVFEQLSPSLRRHVDDLREVPPEHALLSAEVDTLREQIAALGDANGPLAAKQDRAPCASP